MSQPKVIQGASSSGHVTMIDNTAKKIQRAKKKAQKESQPKFKVVRP